MELLKKPVYVVQWEGELFAQDDTHAYAWLWYGWNIRLIAVPLREGLDGGGYDFGWCYPRDPEKVKASVRDWDPDTQDEPVGWHKRATPIPRRAPRRDPENPMNAWRCMHGAYSAVEDACHTTVCHDTIAYREARDAQSTAPQ